MADESALGLVTKINQELEKANRLADNLSKGLAGGAGSVGTSGGSMMPGSLASVTAAGRTMNRMSVAAGLAQGAFAATGDIIGGLPGVAQVFAREGGFYGAAVRAGGGMSRRVLADVTFSGLRGGLSYAGADADIAAYAATAGVNLNSSYYRNLLGGAGAATKYLNMNTLSAFQAMEGLTSGVGSGNFMARYGIFTSDPRTGQVKGQGQIFEELAQRMTAGQPKATEAQILEDLRRGPLGSNIRNSGMTADQQYLFSQYMIERARGRKLDLEDPGTVSQLMADAEAQGNANPFASAYRINTAQTGALEKASENYVKAIQDATPAIELFNAAAGELSTSIVGYANALAQVALGDKSTGGVLRAAGDLLGPAALLAGSYGIGKAGGTAAVINKAGSMLKTGMTAAGKAVPFVGPVLSAVSGATTSQEDLFKTATTNAAIAAIPALAAAAPTGGFSLLGIPAAFAATYVGNALSQAFSGGDSAPFGQSGFSGGTGGFVPPVTGGRISSPYGAERSGGRIHEGVDIAMPEGTPVYAVAGGKVIKSQVGSGERSYGEYIEIKHSEQYSTLYAHLQKNSRKVSVGDEVYAGQQIGNVGSTGLSTGPHLHFEVRKNGSKVNPNSVLPEDLVGQGKDYSAANNGGQTSSSITQRSSARSLLEMAVNPVAGGLSMISVSAAGVKGRSYSTSQVIASSFGTSTRGLSSPASTALGTDSGGAEGFLPLSTTSTVASKIETKRSAVSSTISREQSGGNQVTINVNVAQASLGEAKRLAEMVKTYLEDDMTLSQMGRR